MALSLLTKRFISRAIDFKNEGSKRKWVLDLLTYLDSQTDAINALVTIVNTPTFTYPGAGIAVSTGSAWNTSITNNSSNWDTAYTERAQWDGGSTNLVAATGRSSLGLGNAVTKNQYFSSISGSNFVSSGTNAQQVPGLKFSSTVFTAGTYLFRVRMFVLNSADTNAVSFGLISASSLVTSVNSVMLGNTSSTSVFLTSVNKPADAAGTMVTGYITASGMTGIVEMTGTFVSSGGTDTIAVLAQKATAGTITIYVGSTFEIIQL